MLTQWPRPSEQTLVENYETRPSLFQRGGDDHHAGMVNFNSTSQNAAQVDYGNLV